MAKDKTNAGGKARKAKIPKKIAGVKIPKTLRDSGKAAIKLSQNPMARELLSAGLMAAAAAVAANSRARKAAREGGHQAAEAMADAAGQAADGAAKIKDALIGAAGLAAQRFFGLDKDAESRADAASQADGSMSEPARQSSASAGPGMAAAAEPQPAAVNAKPAGIKRKAPPAEPSPNGKA